MPVIIKILYGVRKCKYCGDGDEGEFVLEGESLICALCFNYGSDWAAKDSRLLPVVDRECFTSNRIRCLECLKLGHSFTACPKLTDRKVLHNLMRKHKGDSICKNGRLFWIVEMNRVTKDTLDKRVAWWWEENFIMFESREDAELNGRSV